jgi:chemotaxis protein MotB
MARTSKITFVLLLVTLFAAVGCQDPEKTALQNDLQVARNNLRAAEAKNEQLTAENLRLMAELEDMGPQLQIAQNRILSLENDLRAYEDGGITIGVAEGWDRSLGGDRLMISSDVLFSAGSATLSAKGKSALDSAARDLKGTYSGLPVRVYGYTDSDPIKRTADKWTDNLDLSANRAMAVTRYLISKGISAEDIETVGMGDTHPVASNASKDGKAQNRRVEIVVVR